MDVAKKLPDVHAFVTFAALLQVCVSMAILSSSPRQGEGLGFREYPDTRCRAAAMSSAPARYFI